MRDYDSFHKSFCDVYALRPQQFQLGFLKVLKGSHMIEMTEEYGIVYKEREPYEVLSTAWLTIRGHFEAENGGKYGGSVL